MNRCNVIPLPRGFAVDEQRRMWERKQAQDAADKARHQVKPGFDAIERAMDEQGHLGRIVADGPVVVEHVTEKDRERARDRTAFRDQLRHGG